MKLEVTKRCVASGGKYLMVIDYRKWVKKCIPWQLSRAPDNRVRDSEVLLHSYDVRERLVMARGFTFDFLE